MDHLIANTWLGQWLTCRVFSLIHSGVDERPPDDVQGYELGRLEFRRLWRVLTFGVRTP